MEGMGEVGQVEDDLRSEYDLSTLVRVPLEMVRRKGRPKVEPLELTSAFPEIEDTPPPGFEWDDNKAASNFRKHGVTFNEASTVFDNPLAALVYDPDNSEDEVRYLIVGDSARGRLLFVSHSDRKETTRIISAREATPRERRSYQNGDVR
ncbi:MAG: BrnT family toxin [Planctomycetota bacterium]